MFSTTKMAEPFSIIALVAALGSFMALLMQNIRKSRCNKITCCCCELERILEPNVQPPAEE